MSEELSNGEMTDSVPQYIKTLENNQFIPVTSMLEAFMGVSTLKVAPKIPSTVTNMQGAFKDCINLKTAKIPNNVTNLTATFQNCSSLEQAPDLPENAESISWAFYNCSSLTVAPIIPEKVKNMRSTFNQCTNLISGSDIPKSVENMQYTYMGCSKLTGTIEINANITSKNIDGHEDYYQCFWDAATDNNANLSII